ncbi:hypothetical protein K490DRAFT_19514, partial [Saccharata proteae CBS 121410]
SSQERTPPGLPTPVTFPSFEPPPQKPQHWSGDGASPPDLFRLFATVRKPSDLSLEHLSALNVGLEPPTDFETLLSAIPDGASYLPPRSWLSDLPCAENDPPTHLLTNGNAYPGKADFAIRLTELVLDNQDAFRNLTRTPLPDRKPPRIAHFRRFFEALDNMAYYWDTSLDEYIPPKPEEETPTNGGTSDENLEPTLDQTEQPPEPTLDPTSAPKDSRGLAESTNLDAPTPSKKAKTEPFTVVPTTDGTSIVTTKLAQRPAHLVPPTVASRSEPTVPGTYKGLRIGTGRSMPDSYRTETVKSFIEPMAWLFNLTISPHRRPPALQMANLRMPGYLIGPVAGIRSGGYVDFGGGEGGDGCNSNREGAQKAALLDLLRELGALLTVAQERAREGRTERKPGDGQWWSSKPRWGGGAGGEVGEGKGELDPNAAPPAADAPKPTRRTPRPGAPSRKKQSALDMWREVKPGMGTWDPKIEYEAIGRDRSGEWDDVFLFSSLNTHISLLHLHVHPAYLAYLETGELPTSTSIDPNWDQPTLRRTRWYDFFNIEERSEAMRGVWGLFAYLSREEGR